MQSKKRDPGNWPGSRFLLEGSMTKGSAEESDLKGAFLQRFLKERTRLPDTV